ncbi:MAG: hypothetical protein RLZZ597_2998 [Cyanobacteriota bacterium]|jgi:hypothetical protein
MILEGFLHMSLSHSFKLAPMSPLIRGLTLILWLLPLTFGTWALVSHERIAGIIFLLLIALYGATWVWYRPSRFVISPDSLKIIFPGWQRRIPMGDISHICITSKEDFRQQFGWAIRIGVGGLWGGFGWLWTAKQGLVEFYISQLDSFVLIKRTTGKSLLITPDNPNQLVEIIQEMLS